MKQQRHRPPPGQRKLPGMPEPTPADLLVVQVVAEAGQGERLHDEVIAHQYRMKCLLHTGRELGFTSTRLAEIAGITEAMVSRILGGSRWPEAHARFMAEGGQA